MWPAGRTLLRPGIEIDIFSPHMLREERNECGEKESSYFLISLKILQKFPITKGGKKRREERKLGLKSFLIKPIALFLSILFFFH